MIQRSIEKRIIQHLFRGRVVSIYGARRVGKTTLVQAILAQYKDRRTRYLNCDLQSVQLGLGLQEAEPLKAFLGDQDLVVLDEAQNIPEIGKVLKILVDTYPEMQIIATGSSTFELAHMTSAALTGRVYPFSLYPLSLQEIAGQDGYSVIEPRLEHLLRFGLYPSIFGQSEEEARTQLDELVSSYLYKDILAHGGIKQPMVLRDLVRLLALQVGSEVSYNELANKLGINRSTVLTYIDLLEQCFVVFRLGAFSRNLRNEVAKSQKVFFYDLGVRNAILQAFAPLTLRTDIGSLWENFCILERLKYTDNNGMRMNRYFWRTYNQKEIDYIEERDGLLTGYECKWNPDKKLRVPELFTTTYPGSTVERIDRSNYWKYLLSRTYASTIVTVGDFNC
jgi:predicted AAA+ superfamily ATPase